MDARGLQYVAGHHCPHTNTHGYQHPHPAPHSHGHGNGHAHTHPHGNMDAHTPKCLDAPLRYAQRGRGPAR